MLNSDTANQAGNFKNSPSYIFLGNIFFYAGNEKVYALRGRYLLVARSDKVNCQ